MEGFPQDFGVLSTAINLKRTYVSTKNKVQRSSSCPQGITFVKMKMSFHCEEKETQIRPPLGLSHFHSEVKLRLHWELFYCFWFEILKSKKFRRSFVYWLLGTIETEPQTSFLNIKRHQTKKLLQDSEMQYHYENALMNLRANVKIHKNSKMKKNLKIKIDVYSTDQERVRNVSLELRW